MGGKRGLIAPLSQQAMDLGFDGLMIESHCCPDCALSDKDQQVTPETLAKILASLVVRDVVNAADGLDLLREQINQIDTELMELMARRMKISKEIGEYKKDHKMPVLQTRRYDDIINQWAMSATQLGLDDDFVKSVYRLIHEESVRQQLEVLNGSDAN